MKTKKPKKPTGKERGLSLRRCLLTSKLYSRDMEGPLPYLYVIPLIMAWLVNDYTLRIHYDKVGVAGWNYYPAFLFTIGWICIVVGLVFALPTNGLKFPFRCVVLMFCMANMETHSGFYNFFGKFFSLSSLGFVGDGQFASRAYIHIDGFILFGAILTIILMMCSGRMLTVMPPKPHTWTVLVGLAAMVIGIGLIADTQRTYFPPEDTVVWKQEEQNQDQNAQIYNSFTDTTNCVMLCGLYQYTARDIWALIGPDSTMSPVDRQKVEAYIKEYEAAQEDNEYTGLLKGKNVILVQLEAMDTWLIDEDYTPTLARLRDEGISFVNHYTPSFIPAGTFNTEFIVNTSLIPASGAGIPVTVYQENEFPYSLANLFRNAGYHAESFHGSEGNVYQRGKVHPNLGYEKYNSGKSMKMEYYQMDRYLINGFEKMTEGDPFFSFVITYSVHGPYGHNAIYEANGKKAEKIDKIQRGNTRFAIAGAIETDMFVEELMDSLEDSGHLDDTVVIFYPDHMNFYLQDDALEKELRGVTENNLLLHTDFFIWSPELKARKVEKVTSSLDVLPTIANLFDLDTQGAFLVGHDGLGDQGGYVFFNDGSWYDGETYWDSQSREEGDPVRNAEINRVRSLASKVLAGNYYGQGFGEALGKAN